MHPGFREEFLWYEMRGNVLNRWISVMNAIKIVVCNRTQVVARRPARAAIARATEMGAEVINAPHRNPPSGDGGPNHRECWFRDLDGYIVVLAGPDGEAG